MATPFLSSDPAFRAAIIIGSVPVMVAPAV
jgi:hypothetical protein